MYIYIGDKFWESIMKRRTNPLMKCAIAESYTHIGQAQIDKGEVRDRASVEHNRRDEDHTGTPVRERELEYQGNTWVLLIHNSAGIYYCI